MAKKILLGLGAVLVVAAGVAAMAAFEAHVINVTAHIENALAVSPESIDFGISFPEETRHRTFQVDCSTSFTKQDRIDDIEYKIVQKPKPKGDPREMIEPEGLEPLEAWDFCLNYTKHPDYLEYCYLNLCPFLNKIKSGDEASEEDTEELAYLAQTEKDCEDTWSIIFNVPCIEGYTPQGDECLTVPENDKDYGCDIWIEVTDFSPWEE
jgi:hypothetical protein